MTRQLSLLPRQPTLPEGFRYETEFLTEGEEHLLIENLRQLPFKEFDFHGFLGKRRIVSFGWQYDFDHAKLRRSEAIPAFLMPVRKRAADFAKLDADAIEHVLVTEYGPGASIGWHRDRFVFDDVIGVSLLSPCRFRFRKRAADGWQRASIVLAPRSVYLMRGSSRRDWEHSLPGVENLRFSLTFRSFAEGVAGDLAS